MNAYIYVYFLRKNKTKISFKVTDNFFIIAISMDYFTCFGFWMDFLIKNIRFESNFVLTSTKIFGLDGIKSDLCRTATNT